MHGQGWRNHRRGRGRRALARWVLTGDGWNRRPDTSPAAGPGFASAPPSDGRHNCTTWERDGVKGGQEPTTVRCLRTGQRIDRQRLSRPTEATRRRMRDPDSKGSQLCRKTPRPLLFNYPSGYICCGAGVGAGSEVSARIGIAARSASPAAVVRPSKPRIERPQLPRSCGAAEDRRLG